MKIFRLACLAALVAASAGAFELRSDTTFGNLAFDMSRKTSLGTGVFEPALAWGASIQASERVAENISFSAGIERDPTLKTLVTTGIVFDTSFVRLTVGPFFGPFNSDSLLLTSGISTVLRAELPGVLFGSFRSDSTIGAGATSPGDYVQQRSELAAGVWLPNVLISGRLANDIFSYRESQELLIVDRRTRYELTADTFKKNFPYTIQLKIGYENLRRSYLGLTAATSANDELGSVLFGLIFAVNLNDNIKVETGAESALYAWGIGTMTSPPYSTLLYKLRAGVIFSYPTAASDE